MELKDKVNLIREFNIDGNLQKCIDAGLIVPRQYKRMIEAGISLVGRRNEASRRDASEKMLRHIFSGREYNYHIDAVRMALPVILGESDEITTSDWMTDGVILEAEKILLATK